MVGQSKVRILPFPLHSCGGVGVYYMSDINQRNPETGRFEATTEAAVANQYVRGQVGVPLDELMAVYQDVRSSRIGRFLFG